MMNKRNDGGIRGIIYWTEFGVDCKKKFSDFIEFPLYGTFSVTIDYFTFVHVIFENFMGIW